MTNQQILTKAIQKAQKNGFMFQWKFEHTKNMGWTMVLREKPKQTPRGLTANITYMQSEFDIIFNHDFAKVLWGESTELPQGKSVKPALKVVPPWKWHLQQMVIAKDPIKYLGGSI